MSKRLLATVIALAIATPALAQVGPGPAAPLFVPPGAPGIAAPQVGSTGDATVLNYTPTGRAADVISNDSAAAGNANQLTRAVPQGGGGGGSGGSNN